MPTFKESLAAGGEVLASAGERGDGPIEVVDHDPFWPLRFGVIRGQLTDVLGDRALRIDHVGSTAVPGLAAKPIIDIQVSVADVDDEDAFVEPIESLGYGLRFREPGHRYFRPVPGLPRQSQIHVCSAGSEWERVHLLFRDFLRDHPDRARMYGDLKRGLAERHRDDRIAYTDAKGPFIEETLRSAESWATETGWTT